MHMIERLVKCLGGEVYIVKPLTTLVCKYSRLACKLFVGNTVTARLLVY